VITKKAERKSDESPFETDPAPFLSGINSELLLEEAKDIAKLLGKQMALPVSYYLCTVGVCWT